MGFLNDITRTLYQVQRTAGKANAMAKDARDISNGDFERMLKRKAKSNMYKSINKTLRGF